MSTILVTGGNRGIGFAIVQLCATRLPEASIIIGCRSKVGGEEAVQRLQGLGLKNSFDTVTIDIENDASIESAAGAINAKYGKLDGELLTRFRRLDSS